MSLRDAFPARTIDTSSHDIVRDFFMPMLQNAMRYDRGVGYFSSGWLQENAKGMVEFAGKGGRARWITSPNLSESDWESLRKGEQARRDEMLRETLGQNIDDLEQSLNQDTLSALAWMVADGILDFRLALPHEKLDRGEFHDKFGIFEDAEDNRVSFNGSYNDSKQGLRNFESISVFCSWDLTNEFVRNHDEKFQRLWENEDPNVQTYGLPNAAREKILKLRSSSRPYERDGNRTSSYEYPGENPSGTVEDSDISDPRIPGHIELRDYQREAVENWFGDDCRGIFEMATGTGKTITALAGATRLWDREGEALIIVACPFTHLATQWEEEIEPFQFNSTLAFGTSSTWTDRLARKLHGLSSGYIDNLVVLTTHDTLKNPKFYELIEGAEYDPLLIVDEVHDAGSPQRKKGLRPSYRYRLGLSATPERWFDEEGTKWLFDYFEDTVFEFSLAQAIPRFLTPYEYIPSFVELQGDELTAYKEETRKIARKAHATDDLESDETLQLYLILRKRIIKNAQAKYDQLEGILDDLDSHDHTLIYCSPQQIDEVQERLNRRGIIQSRFTGEETTEERKELLRSFDKGTHEMLVAMKCLDQGVDVPATRRAVLMASSGNPKQFIQRRGRVLRKAEGKEKAIIHDIIVVPSLEGSLDDEARKLERKILLKELQRYYEFADTALNRQAALNKLGPVQRRYRISRKDIKCQ
jgi:superfamily II DNA or RNA helicase